MEYANLLATNKHIRQQAGLKYEEVLSQLTCIFNQ